MAQVSCRAFDQVGAALDRNSLNRFIAGVDAAPRKMTPAEVAELDDPVARLLFATGNIPRSGEQLLEGIKAALPAGDPLREQASFVVGEGSQLPVAPATPAVSRSIRFVLTLGRTE